MRADSIIDLRRESREFKTRPAAAGRAFRALHVIPVIDLIIRAMLPKEAEIGSFQRNVL